MEIRYQPIGIVRTPFKNLDEIPRQSTDGGIGVEGTVEIFLFPGDYQEIVTMLLDERLYGFKL